MVSIVLEMREVIAIEPNTNVQNYIPAVTQYVGTSREPFSLRAARLNAPEFAWLICSSIVTYHFLCARHSLVSTAFYRIQHG